MLVREDDRNTRSMRIQSQDLKRRGAPDFSKAHNEFDRKLAEVERHLNAKRRNERAIALAEEEVRKQLAEEAAAKLLADEQARMAELEAEEARKKAEYEAAREAELEEARRLAAERKQSVKQRKKGWLQKGKQNVKLNLKKLRKSDKQRLRLKRNQKHLKHKWLPKKQNKNL